MEFRFKIRDRLLPMQLNQGYNTRYKNLKAKTVLSFKGAFQVVTDFRVANLLKVTAEQE